MPLWSVHIRRERIHYLPVQVMGQGKENLDLTCIYMVHVGCGVWWLEGKLASTEDRTHHRHVHVGTMAESVPR